MPLVATRSNAGAFGLGWGVSLGKASAMTAIASTTLSTATSNITFSSISSSYDDLFVSIYAKGTTGGQILSAQFNSDTNSNYGVVDLYGSTSIGSSNSITRAQIDLGYNIPLLSGTNKFSACHVNILNYSNTSRFKTVISRLASDENTSTVYGQGVSLAVGTWRSTSAISSIKIYASSGNLDSGTVVALYGIKKAA